MRASSLLAFALLGAPLVIQPLACSSTTIVHANPGDDGGTGDDDGGVAGDDGGTTSKDGGKDAGPFNQAAHPAYPQVPKNGSSILTNFKLVTITMPSETSQLTTAYQDFGDHLIASNWLKGLAAEYGLGSGFTHTNVVGASFSGSTISQSQMESYIASAISGKGLASNGHTMFMLYLPAGVHESQDPTCQQYGGYHLDYQGTNDGWGFVHYCQSPGMSQQQYMTMASSHEIIEAVTDAVPGSGWTLPSPQSAPWNTTVWATLQGEIGDLCASTQAYEGLDLYQRVWSNKAAQGTGDPCVPTLNRAYYNTSVPQDANSPKGWFKVAAGGKIDIPVTGFSTARMNDWIIDAAITGATTQGFTVKLTSPTTISAQGQTLNTINNGGTATLTISASGSVGSGNYAHIYIVSQEASAGGDPYHVWPVGAYVQ